MRNSNEYLMCNLSNLFSNDYVKLVILIHDCINIEINYQILGCYWFEIHYYTNILFYKLTN